MMFVGPGEQFPIQDVNVVVPGGHSYSYLDLLVCECVTVDKFYVQLLSKSLELEDLMNALEQYYTEEESRALTIGYARKNMQGKIERTYQKGKVN